MPDRAIRTSAWSALVAAIAAGTGPVLCSTAVSPGGAPGAGTASPGAGAAERAVPATAATDVPYRPPVRIEDDPPAFYDDRYYRERGLPNRAGGFDARAEGWVQPFSAYVASRPLRPTRGRHTVYLIPLGPVVGPMRERVALVRAFLEAYLTLPTVALGPAPLVGGPRRTAVVGGRTVVQHEAAALVDEVLRPLRPQDAYLVVGLATADLWARGTDLKSVAHLARRAEGLAVVNLARTMPEFFGRRSRPETRDRDLRLAFGMVADAACRAIGLVPCRKYYCVMNQARRASTVEPLHLCPDCLRKLRWTLGFDVPARYERLARFYRRAGLLSEARWVERRLRQCRGAEGP